MWFNATKCYTMSISRKHPSSYFYSLNQTILKSVTTNPYLGVHFSADISRSNHINITTKKVHTALGFLKCNIRHCPTYCKRTAYISLVRIVLDQYWTHTLNTLNILINAPVHLFFQYVCALSDALILNNVCQCYGLKQTLSALIYLFSCTNHSFSAAIQFTCLFF